MMNTTFKIVLVHMCNRDMHWGRRPFHFGLVIFIFLLFFFFWEGGSGVSECYFLFLPYACHREIVNPYVMDNYLLWNLGNDDMIHINILRSLL